MEPNGITIDGLLAKRMTPTRVPFGPMVKLDSILATKSFIVTKLLYPTLPDASNIMTKSKALELQSVHTNKRIALYSHNTIILCIQ